MWLFEQISGRFSQDGELIGVGYAGRNYNDSGDWVHGKNNPDMEAIKGIGPLPAGHYTGRELYPTHPVLGNFAIRLEPDEETRAKILTYERDPDSFFLHGDSAEAPGKASHGCIVQSLDVRHKFWYGVDREIDVVAGG